MTRVVELRRRTAIRYGLGQPPALSDDGVPIIRATNIERGRIVTRDLVRARIEDLPLDRAPLLLAGEVLVVRSGAYTGDSALVTEEWAGSAPGYDLRITPDAGMDPRFLAYSLRGQLALDQMALAATRAAQPHLNAEELGSVEVLDVPLSAQRRVADFLDFELARIDSLVRAKRCQVEALLERRATVTMYLVTQGATPQRSACSLTWATSIPAHWRVAKLSLVARVGSGHTPSRSHPEWWVDCTVPWITTGEVAQMRSDRTEEITETREMISELGLANSSATIHPKGTVVLCRTASAGYSAIMGKDMATSQDFATWTCGPLLRPRYLLLCLRAMRRDLLERLAMGSTHKTIYMPDIEAIRVPLPPVEEQDEIVERTWRQLRAIDRAVDAIEQHIGLLQERKQALITAAVTGQLDLAREIAEEAS